MRCLYCGKGLWPLRGLIDSDFCSRSHRKNYHDRVRKAMGRLPQFDTPSETRQSPPTISGFAAAGPSVGKLSPKKPGLDPSWQPVTLPATLPMRAQFSARLASPSFSGYSTGVPLRSIARAVSAFEPRQFASAPLTGSLSALLHYSRGALAMAPAVPAHAEITLRPVLVKSAPAHAAFIESVPQSTASKVSRASHVVPPGIQAAALPCSQFVATPASRPGMRAASPTGENLSILHVAQPLAIATFDPAHMTPGMPSSDTCEVRPVARMIATRAVSTQALQMSGLSAAQPLVIGSFDPAHMAPGMPSSDCCEVRPVARTVAARAVSTPSLQMSGIRLSFPTQESRRPEVSSASELAFVLPELAFHSGDFISSERPAVWQFKVNGFTAFPETKADAAEPALRDFSAIPVQPLKASAMFEGEISAHADWLIESSGMARTVAFHASLQATHTEFQAFNGAAITPSQAAARGAGTPVGWHFRSSDRQQQQPVTFRSGLESLQPAMNLAQPATRTWKCAPVALLDQVTVASPALRLPDLKALHREPLVPTALSADLMPGYSDAFGPQTKIGETLLPRGSGWFPLEAQSILPSTPFPGPCAPVGGSLTPAVSIGAQSGPGESSKNAVSMNPALPIQLPALAVQYRPDALFSAVPIETADGSSEPSITQKFAPAPLTAPTHQVSLQPAHFVEGLAAQLALSAAPGPMSAVDHGSAVAVCTIHVPEIKLNMDSRPAVQPFPMSVRPATPALAMPGEMGWAPFALALQIPVIDHREYPLALKIALPELEKQTTIVTEVTTAAQPKDRVLPITTEIKNKKPLIERIPKSVFQYASGIAASLVVGSFLWFGASRVPSISSSGPTRLIATALHERAAFESEDNFHNGLKRWDGTNLPVNWKVDPDGFLRPGKLGLYKDSKDMTDYRLEFLAQIERKSLGWVFRATDEKNYHAMKLTVANNQSPRLMASLIHYSVVAGEKGQEVETPLQIMLHHNRPYRVQVDVKGNQFKTSVEGQVVDTWSDDRLRAGAVGFFTDSGEKARLYWMRISKNTDFLGRLCAFLAPGGLPGVWMPFVGPNLAWNIPIDGGQ